MTPVTRAQRFISFDIGPHCSVALVMVRFADGTWYVDEEHVAWPKTRIQRRRHQQHERRTWQAQQRRARLRRGAP